MLHCLNLKVLLTIVLQQFFVPYVHLYANFQHEKLTRENFVTQNILKVRYYLFQE